MNKKINIYKNGRRKIHSKKRIINRKIVPSKYKNY